MYDSVIIGGGLAGLTSAIHLARAGCSVLVIEKKQYPFNKVCGEYISNEVLPYWRQLGIDPINLGAKSLTKFWLTTPNGQSYRTPLPLGGFSIKRFTIDQHLYTIARQQGVEFLLGEKVFEVKEQNDHFEVLCTKEKTFSARLVIGSYGKRSNLDQSLNRPFFQIKSDFIGVKNYYRGSFPDDVVSLHLFEGGYCGLSQVEDGTVNLAYLSTAGGLKKYGSIEKLEEKALKSNPVLQKFLVNSTPVLEKNLAISNISFKRKSLIHDHVLMTGDSAGMIPPLCGNGMAMAIHSAKIISELSISFHQQKITRQILEKKYRKAWNQQFRYRLWWGRHFQQLFLQPQMANTLMQPLGWFPGLLPWFIKQTHGGVVPISPILPILPQNSNR